MIKKISHLGSLLVLFLLLFFGCGEEAGRNVYAKAKSAIASGDYVRARILLEKAMRKSVPVAEKREIANQLGIILWQLNEPEEALEAFTKANELSETHNAASLNRASALLALNQFDEAEVSLNHLITNPDFATQAYALLCALEIQRGNLEKADEALKAASAQLSDSAALLVAAAHIDLRLYKDPLRAKKRLAQALALQSSYPPAHYNMALLQEQWLGDRAAAAVHYQDYLAHQQTDSPYIAEAKEALSRLTQLETSALSSDPALAKQWLLKGVAAYNQKKYQQAIDYFNQAISADPQAESSHYNLALAYYHLNAYTSAQLAFKEVLKINPNFADAHYMLTITLIQAKKLDEAETAAKALALLDAKRGESMLRHISKARQEVRSAP